MTGIARLSLFALDCPDPQALAAFYSRLTGWESDGREGEWVELRSPGDVTIAFQRVDDYRPPQWPGQDQPQQGHLDFDVDDLDAGEREVLAIGARKADFQPGGDEFRVYLDPDGHPFCLVKAGT